MAAQKNDQKELKFRGVYLADLKPIKAIYLGSDNNDTHLIKQDKLSEQFGIPLNLVEWNEKVIAYSFVNMDAEITARIQVKIAQEFKSMNIADQLTEFTMKSQKGVYGLNGGLAFSDTKSIQNAIRSLVDWMNQCN